MNKVFASLVLLILCAGCGSKKVKPWRVEGKGPGAGELKDSNWVAKYRVFTVHMSEKQRAVFHQILTNKKRDIYLVRNGIHIKRKLNTKLRKGMNPVNARRMIGGPQRVFRDNDDLIPIVTWHYAVFNGYGETRYQLVFRNGKLNAWHVYTKE